MGNCIDVQNRGCAGCGACAVICPSSAVSIRKNENGFYEASVNYEKCVECGLCKKVCIRECESVEQNIRDGKLYAMQSKAPSVVGACTSGGIAFEMAEYCMKEKDMVVVGTVYNYHKNIAEMVIAQSLQDIERMRGSKYLQSAANNVISDIFELAKIDKEKRFLVIGTACQIYGIQAISVLLGIRERFLLVDVFCHGVPSYLVWENFLEECEKKTGIKQWQDVRFRDARQGWHNFVLSLEAENQTLKFESENCLFYHAFFDNVLLSRACFDCKARCEGSGADIRLGDFWGSRYQERNDGVSAVLIQTESGKQMLDEIDKLNILAETTTEECLSAQSVNPYPRIELHEQALEELRCTGNLKATIIHYRKKLPLKVRIKTFCKEATGILPANIRQKLKKAYRKRKK